MNKYILILVALVFSKLSFGQTGATTFPIDPETKKIDYTEVVQVMTTDKNTLYTRAKGWAAPLTKVEDNAQEFKSVSKGQIKVKYPAPMRGYFHDGFINYTVKIFCKDGKYKYDVTDIIHESERGNGGPLEGANPACGKYTLTQEGWGVIKKKALEELPKVVESLKAGMSGSAAAPTQAAKTEKDW